MEELEASNETVVHKSELTADKANDSLAFLRKLVEESVKLSNNVKNLDKIVEAITSIGEQTKLLALNASVEAARANFVSQGSDGRSRGNQRNGFAVVAEEIKKLADQSKDEVAKINPFSKQLQQEFEGILKGAQESLTNIEISVENMDEIVASTEEIGAVINEVNREVENLNYGNKDFLINLDEDN